MKLNNDLITQFAKITKVDNKKNEATTVRGVARMRDGQNYIQIDGADESSLTPVDTTVEVTENDRVIAIIKDHSATITGNTSDPAVGVKTANGLRSSIEQTAAEIRTEVENEVSGLKSTISQTADRIRTEVESEVAGLNSTINQTASQINAKINSNNNQFTEFKQTVEGFYFTDNDGTVYIDGGDVYAKNLKLTGAISWGDLDSNAQDKVTNAEELAEDASTDAAVAKALAQSAWTRADEAYTLANGNTVTLPSYIKSTYIDEVKIESPTIIGGRLYGVGTNPNYASTFSVMDEDGFYIYHNATQAQYEDDTYRLIPKMSLTTLSSGKEIRLVLGSGESTSDPNAWYNRFYISKRTTQVDISYIYNWDGDSVGFSFKDGEDWIYIHGQICGRGGVFPVGYIYLSFDTRSPADLFGGSWQRLSGYFLYATGSDANVGVTGTVVTAGGTNSAQYIMLNAWRRIA